MAMAMPEVQRVIADLPHGLHLNIPPAMYHARVPGMVSKSALDLVHRSPAHYKAWCDGGEDDQTEALFLGGAFHCALLEPERFESEFVEMPDFGDRRFKEAKDASKKWADANATKTHLTAEQARAIRGMVASIRKHPLASKALRDGEPEATVRWRDEETGLECKARADYLVRRLEMVIDVKSADDASYEAFRRAVVRYRYHVQDALYRSAFGAIGAPVRHFVFVVVEKRAPFAVATYTLDTDAIQRGYAHARLDIDTLACCVREDDWPGYPTTIQTLDLPPWAA